MLVPMGLGSWATGGSGTDPMLIPGGCGTREGIVMLVIKITTSRTSTRESAIPTVTTSTRATALRRRALLRVGVALRERMSGCIVSGDEGSGVAC